MFWNTFLSVLGVIGIVAIAAFIIVFLSDLFISIIDGTNGIFFKRHKNDVNDNSNGSTKRPKLLNGPTESLNEPAKQLEHQERAFNEENVEEEDSQDIDFEKAREEERELRRKNEKDLRTSRSTSIIDDFDDEDEDEDDFVKTVPVKTNKPASVDNTKIMHEISEETKAYLEKEEKKEEKPAKVEIEKIIKEEPKAEPKEEKVEEPSEEDLAKQKEYEEAIAQKEALEDEIEKLRAQLEENQETIKELKEQADTAKTVKPNTETREALEKRLEVLRQRLKENEKELSANRKEFVPLRRVNKTLDSDKRKLRRKEAIVAKQKVVLYGVNNYVDINEEKAKKLSEELDLLEGLRLSVQHCEEVMQKNKDRYPILERANQFLVKSQTNLKEDIADIEARLQALDEEDNSNDDTNTDSNENVEVEVLDENSTDIANTNE